MLGTQIPFGVPIYQVQSCRHDDFACLISKSAIVLSDRTGPDCTNPFAIRGSGVLFNGEASQMFSPFYAGGPVIPWVTSTFHPEPLNLNN